MKKKIIRVALVLLLVLFATGLMIVLSALTIGTNTADEYLYAHGGSLPTVHYERIIEQVTWNYRAAGLVLSLIGGMGALLAAFAIYREIPSI